jgi:predicted methyltransferase
MHRDGSLPNRAGECNRDPTGAGFVPEPDALVPPVATRAPPLLACAHVTPGRNLMRHRLLNCALALLALLASAAVLPAMSDDYAKALADRTRPDSDRKLDADRKPAELMAVAGIKPGMTVAEFIPGGGYYTRLLSDVVGPTGRIYALETTTFGKENVDQTEVVLKDPGRANVKLDLAPLGTFRLADKVDLFWTTLNYHDLHVPEFAHVDMAAFNKLVFDGLKPGGIYFIDDHAAAAGSGDSASPTLHRIDKALVIKEVTAAGFTLVTDSDVLRHPADDHTKKVFDPAVRMKTDQFVLVFRRP